jgi:hypothetical protein
MHRSVILHSLGLRIAKVGSGAYGAWPVGIHRNTLIGKIDRTMNTTNQNGPERHLRAVLVVKIFLKQRS